MPSVVPIFDLDGTLIDSDAALVAPFVALGVPREAVTFGHVLQDECDRLGLSEGHRARVGLPGREPAEVLVTEIRRVPPVVWLDLRPLA